MQRSELLACSLQCICADYLLPLLSPNSTQALLPTDFGFLLDIPAFMAGIWSDDAQPFSETDLVRWLQENAELRVEQLRLLPFMRDVDLANSKAIQVCGCKVGDALLHGYVQQSREVKRALCGSYQISSISIECSPLTRAALCLPTAPPLPQPLRLPVGCAAAVPEPAA